MNTGRDAKVSVLVDAAPEKVWEALTDPKLVKEYLFGTEVEERIGKPGSQIRYRGVWQGKAYEDKGEILQVEPGRLIASTFFSALSGLEDSPENYKVVRYELQPQGNGTLLTVVQENNSSEEEASHSEENWKIVLDGLKKLVEGQK